MSSISTPPRRDTSPSGGPAPRQPTGVHTHPPDGAAIERSHRRSVEYGIGAGAAFVAFLVLAGANSAFAWEEGDAGYRVVGYVGLALFVAEGIFLVGLARSLVRSHRLRAGATTMEATLPGPGIEFTDRVVPSFRWAASIVLGLFCWGFGFAALMASLQGTGEAWMYVLAACFAVAGVFGVWFVLRQGLFATPHKLIYKGRSRTLRIPWSDIDRLGARVVRTYGWMRGIGSYTQLTPYPVVWTKQGVPLTLKVGLFPAAGEGDKLSEVGNAMLAGAGDAISTARAEVIARWMREHGVALTPSWDALVAWASAGAPITEVEIRGNAELGTTPNLPTPVFWPGGVLALVGIQILRSRGMQSDAALAGGTVLAGLGVALAFLYPRYKKRRGAMGGAR